MTPRDRSLRVLPLPVTGKLSAFCPRYWNRAIATVLFGQRNRHFVVFLQQKILDSRVRSTSELGRTCRFAGRRAACDRHSAARAGLSGGRTARCVAPSPNSGIGEPAQARPAFPGADGRPPRGADLGISDQRAVNHDNCIAPARHRTNTRKICQPRCGVRSSSRGRICVCPPAAPRILRRPAPRCDRRLSRR